MAELLARISSRELAEWMAYDTLEPFGEERADLRSALVACTMANAWRSGNTPAYTIEEFMPFSDKARSHAGLTGKLGAQVAKKTFKNG